MALEQLITSFDAYLTDERVLAAVREFVSIVNYQIEYDAQTFVLSHDVKFHIVDKSMIVDRSHKDGAYLVARVALDPVIRETGYVGVTYSGTVKLFFSLTGEYIDEIYSRNNVIEKSE